MSNKCVWFNISLIIQFGSLVLYQRSSQSRTNITHATYLLSATDLVAKGLLIDCSNWLRFFVITCFSFLLHRKSQCSEWHFCPYYETSRFRNPAIRPVDLNGVLICFFPTYTLRETWDGMPYRYNKPGRKYIFLWPLTYEQRFLYI